MVKSTSTIQAGERLAEDIKSIRLIAFDFDGVFTDNSVYVSEDGRESVRCWRGDGLGLEKLRRRGILLFVVSTETNPVVLHRCKKLKLDCFNACDDKLTVLKDIAQKEMLTLSQVGFVGNDINDAECLRAAKLAMVVRDCHPDVLPLAAYRTTARGGYGAVREICDLFETVLSENGQGMI